MQTISTPELRVWQESGEQFTLVNTLSNEQFARTKVPGSINIPLDSGDFEDKVESAVGSKDAKVVVYCASSECNSSAKAAEKLEAAGFTDVYDYEGGAKAWNEQAKGARQTSR